MKKLFIPLIVTVIFAIVLGVTVAGKNGDSATAAQSQTIQSAIPLGAPLSTDQPADPCAHAEQQQRPDSAEQILTDMNDAHVEERTEELNVAFNRLAMLCESAVKTADAMLSADFEGRATSAVSSEKGPENGDE